MNRRAAVKQQLFRQYIIFLSILLIIHLGFTLESPKLLVFVVPVVALIVFIRLKYTKFCSWCGKCVAVNFPDAYLDKENCPRCGSKLLD